ncbi:MAG: hypothetical protein KC731_13365 [Myxococcales bacterium]|nr:hypothetical protein [Myxococcales bacterium]
MGWRALVHEARQRLAAEGFDLLEACSRLRLADLEEEGLRLAPDGFRPDALTLVVGNGRALWPVVRDRVSRGELAPDADPVDRHSEATMERLGQDLRASFGAPRIALHFAHRRDAEGSYLPFQRIAAATGFAELGPAHLALRPDVGPWFALRALVLIDVPGPPVDEPPRRASLCAGCDAPCRAALERAAASGATWRDWLAVRDACPVGREARYGDAQLRYHYTKDPAAFDG